jgi:hypothetical protein
MTDSSDSFLSIDDVNEANKERLLEMRRALFASVVRNAQSEERKGMYTVSLAIFTEFERLTRHITDPEISKN